MVRSRGLYRAVVDDDQDPLGRGRLRLSVPDVGVAAAWAEACLPPVPLDLLRLPAVGATVWVQFDNGDTGRPVWTGIAWETAVAADRTISSAASLTVRAPMVTIEAGSTEVSGVLKCETLIATTVVATSYTPGAGNIW